MRKKLEILIVSAVLEKGKYKFDVITSSFKAVTSILLSQKDIFEKIPSCAIITSEQLASTDDGPLTTGLTKDLISNFGKQNEKDIKYFDEQGVLLYDGIHASAFGRMSYIYRTKGIRLYLLKSGAYITVTPYCYIDHRGFEFVQEEVDKRDHENLKDEETISAFLRYALLPDDRKKMLLNEELIKFLTSIKKSFLRDYYVEYLFHPPDVDEISPFSKKVKATLWEIVLSKSFQNRWGNEMQYNAMNYLSKLDITPSPGQLIKYIKSSAENSTLKQVLDRIDTLEYNLSNQKQDIFEFKPNFNGVGINGNEIYRRLQKFMS